MPDFVEVLAQDAIETIRSGYYENSVGAAKEHISLKRAIIECKTAPVITEIKSASPSAGVIRKNLEAAELARAMENGGAAGISVLTEPANFNGSLTSLVAARKIVKLPILMKDILLSPVQINAASKVGANAILLIQMLFDRGYCKYNVKEMIRKAHSKNLEVLLEAHSEKEFRSAVATEADLIGINNRDLETFKVDFNTTRRILQNNDAKGKIVISESGIRTPADIRLLRSYGTHGFLVGSAIMQSVNIEEKVKELVHAL